MRHLAHRMTPASRTGQDSGVPRARNAAVATSGQQPVPNFQVIANAKTEGPAAQPDRSAHQATWDLPRLEWRCPTMTGTQFPAEDYLPAVYRPEEMVEPAEIEAAQLSGQMEAPASAARS